MLDWLLRLMSPPMECSCTSEDIHEAEKAALKRRDQIQLDRETRLAEYARGWPSADEQPRAKVVRFYREFRA